MTTPSSSLSEDIIPGGAHWSLTIKAGRTLRLTDLEGNGNVGMLFYNPANLLERYNAPDTLKCQHTFKLDTGNCLYSDMGRIFCSVIGGTVGWHDTVCGNSTRQSIEEKWGTVSYQIGRNDRTQNGRDSFLVEGTKYGLGKRDLAANVNWFSKVAPDADGNLSFVSDNSKAGDYVNLRFEMDTLVLLHTCPHPLNDAKAYPRKPIKMELLDAKPVSLTDECRTSRPENIRGFENTQTYVRNATSSPLGGN